MGPLKLSSAQRAAILANPDGLQYINVLPKPPLGTTWIGGYALGRGAYGEVTLWILLDNVTQKPLKTCAIKDSFDKHSTKEEGLYQNVYQQLVRKGFDFDVDPETELGHARSDQRFCKEAYLQGIMTEPNSKEEMFSVPMWGYKKQLPSLRGSEYNHWRLYMPLYDYSSMFNLMYAHRKARKANPEPFIWHTLHCLFSGAVQLQEQAQKREGSTKSDIIVVFDMKPDNILLAPPSRTSGFPIYPRPHIADLGGGCLTNSEDELNRKSKLICALTRGYVPPEIDAQYVYDDPKTQNMGCHDWTNVWQIARVAEAMMKLTMQPDQIEYRLGKKVEEMEPEILDWEGELPGQDYSMDLRRLLSRCLKFDPTKRPTSRRVLQSITTSPAFLQHRHGMDTFGNDAWFEEQQRKHDEKKAAKPSPKTTPPTLEEVEAATKKRKRLANAEIYTRAWEADKRAKFRELEVLPDEKFDLEYGYNELWSTAQFPLRDENGAFLYDLDHDFLPDGTPYMKGHTASVDIGGLKIATSKTAVEGDAGDEGENDQAGGDNGDDDEDNSRSPSPPFLSIY
ncbi:kinase-like protein, partial [Aureobasidium melanogenum]|uniref:Protein kinase domain-containing protein n=1 Tax=Aureobasidium melanogenum (strain CBS 110374) TaxID=1043003 RepID=A0A074W1J7_AURM1